MRHLPIRAVPRLLLARRAALVAGVAAAVACNDAAGPSSSLILALTLHPQRIELYPGDTITLTAYGFPAGAEVSAARLTWSSRNSGLARVTRGLVTAVAVGSTTIDASHGWSDASAQIDVVPPPEATVMVDFAAAEPRPRSMSGVLHVYGPFPPEHMLAPIQPRLWRTDRLEDYDRVRALGARFTFLLSGSWRAPPWPYQDTTAWVDFVRTLTRGHRGQPVIWEIWNEPDLAYFWDGTDREFFTTYATGERAVRAELGPAALVAGPSIATYDVELLGRFLDYCLAHDCRVPVLTWHELGPDLPAIEQHLREARERFVDNPRYAPLGIREIHINEVTDSDDQYSPGRLLTALHYLERGGADAAARACWNDWLGGTNCEQSNIDGMLTPGDFQPRAAWWTYRRYAEGVDSRVRSASATPLKVALGSLHAATPGAAQVLVADGRKFGPPREDIGIWLRNVTALAPGDSVTHVRITAELIPDALYRPVPALPVVLDTVVAVERRGASLVLPQVETREAFALQLRPAPPPQPPPTPAPVP